jgi:gluconate 2-dehydrogenase gamma chain
MFADPVYGGNRDMVGWKLIGYPGAQRAYTPEDIKNERFRLPPQSIADLAAFHPGEHANPNVILPVSGPNLPNRAGRDAPWWCRIFR